MQKYLIDWLFIFGQIIFIHGQVGPRPETCTSVSIMFFSDFKFLQFNSSFWAWKRPVVPPMQDASRHLCTSHPTSNLSANLVFSAFKTNSSCCQFTNIVTNCSFINLPLTFCFTNFKSMNRIVRSYQGMLKKSEATKLLESTINIDINERGSL